MKFIFIFNFAAAMSKLLIPRFAGRAFLAGMAAVIFAVFCPVSRAQDYLVTYSHQMEEPDNLEIATKAVTASRGAGQSESARFGSPHRRPAASPHAGKP